MDSDDSSIEEVDLNESDRDIEGKLHKGLVSGWDDDNEGIEEEEKPKGNLFNSLVQKSIDSFFYI